MNALKRSSVALITALVAIVGIAYAAQPPNVVVSDGGANTAMGSDALLNLTSGTQDTAAGFNALRVNTTGGSNTATGAYALYSNTTGNYNTAFGSNALVFNTTGSSNTATGTSTLVGNTTGDNNTANGFRALESNTTGTENTAVGSRALQSNMVGQANTATGSRAMFSNTTGSLNTASGYTALFSNTTGSNNAAYGFEALLSNTTGSNNVAYGFEALWENSTGNQNSALGNFTLSNNETGNRNVAVGYSALVDNEVGRSNTAIGAYAGRRTTGNDNILVANGGVVGESQTLRLGTQGSAGVLNSGVTRTFIAGINGVTTSRAGTMVLVDSKGQLGTISSSRRHKQDIQAMADASERLLKLRPVKFHYKQPDAEGTQPIQYGLIAEEVAEVFPEIVVRNEDGQPETVAYHLLPALLLNELQKEHQLNQQHTEQLAAQALQLAEVSSLKQQLAEVKELLAALQSPAKEQQVAMR